MDNKGAELMALGKDWPSGQWRIAQRQAEEQQVRASRRVALPRADLDADGSEDASSQVRHRVGLPAVRLELAAQHLEEVLDVPGGNPAQVAQPESGQAEHFARVDGKAALIAVVVQRGKIELIILGRFDSDHQVALDFLVDHVAQSDFLQSLVDGFPAAGDAFVAGLLSLFPVFLDGLLEGIDHLNRRGEMHLPHPFEKVILHKQVAIVGARRVIF